IPLQNLTRDEEVLAPEDARSLLLPLRQELTGYRLFVLPIVESRNACRVDEVVTMARNLAYELDGGVLALLPTSYPDNLSVLDPMPAFSVAAERPDLWPGLLVWTDRGAAAFV